MNLSKARMMLCIQVLADFFPTTLTTIQQVTSLRLTEHNPHRVSAPCAVGVLLYALSAAGLSFK